MVRGKCVYCSNPLGKKIYIAVLKRDGDVDFGAEADAFDEVGLTLALAFSRNLKD